MFQRAYALIKVLLLRVFKFERASSRKRQNLIGVREIWVSVNETFCCDPRTVNIFGT